MNLQDKLARVKVELESVASHADADAEDVVKVLRSVAEEAKARASAVVKQRIGGIFTRLRRALAKKIAG